MLLQWFAEAGTVVNAMPFYVNAYTGDTTPFTPGSDDLGPLDKTFYETDMLDNTRDQMIYGQLGMKQTLPENHGTSIEWTRWNTLGRIGKLKEGVIPTGKKMGIVAITVSLAQYGDYVTISDLSKKHGVHPIVLGAEEELSASYALTQEELIRNTLIGCTNILFADAYNGSSYVSTPSSEAALQTALASYTCNVTSEVLAKASTQLYKTAKGKKYQGQYLVAVVHPDIAFDIRMKDPNGWIEAHKYAAPEEIFTGEIGRMHGIRFVESNLAPVIKKDGQSYATFKTLVFAKDAFAIVDPEGGNMQMIIKNEDEIGGPLNQFGTVGVKGEMACKILYQERMLCIWSGSSYSSVEDDNLGLDFYEAA
jgi:N4-gp56 family major capsid protein